MFKARIRQVVCRLAPSNFSKDAYYLFVSEVCLVITYTMLLLSEKNVRVMAAVLIGIIITSTLIYIFNFVGGHPYRINGCYAGIGKRIKEIMDSKPYSLLAVAMLFDIDFDHAQKIVTGYALPTINEIYLFASLDVQEPVGHVLYIISGDEQYKYCMLSQIDKKVAQDLATEYENHQSNLFYEALTPII